MDIPLTAEQLTTLLEKQQVTITITNREGDQEEHLLRTDQIPSAVHYRILKSAGEDDWEGLFS